MLIPLIGIVVSLFAVFFAYLSWKETVLTDIFEREERLQTNLESSNYWAISEDYIITMHRIRMDESEGLWYTLKKYFPTGSVDGETQLTMLFQKGSPEPLLGNQKTVQEMEEFGIEVVYRNDLNTVFESVEEDLGENLTLIVDSVDPLTVENKLTTFRASLTQAIERQETSYENSTDDP